MPDHSNEKILKLVHQLIENKGSVNDLCGLHDIPKEFWTSLEDNELQIHFPDGTVYSFTLLSY